MSTKEILVSPGFGAGWSTWNDQGKELAEDLELIAMVKAETHTGSCTAAELRAAGAAISHDFASSEKWGASLAFCIRAMIVNGGRIPYCGGVDDLEVREASSPYRITDYDGSESVTSPGSGEWW